MRIGVDCRAFQYQSRFLGIGRYSRDLLQALRGTLGPHELIPFAHPVPPAGEAEDASLTWVDRDGFRVTTPQSLGAQMARHRLDLHHVLEFLPPYAVPERAVVTVYDLIPLIFPKVYLAWSWRRGWQARRNLSAYYRFVRSAHRIIAISHHTKQDLQRLLGIPAARIVVIYPGINPVFRPLADDAARRAVLARYGLRAPFVLYVGSCDYRKNVPRLLRAFAAARARGLADWSLVLVGLGVEHRRAALERLGTALGLGASLRLLGYVPLDHLAALYNAAAMLVFPSLYEGFGFPPLEAMACGTPVITSNTSSLREVAADGAWLVDPSEDEALAEAIRRLALDRGLRETVARRGLAQARRFQWARAAQETMALYEQASSRS